MSSESPFTLYSVEPKIKILDFNDSNGRINIKISSLILILILLIFFIMYLLTKDSIIYKRQQKKQHDNMPWI